MSCQLCNLCKGTGTITRKYFENDDMLIVDCATCFVPMAVWRTHVAHITYAQKKYVEDIIRREFPWGNYYIDDNMKSIPEHYHCHLRRTKGY